MSFSYRERGKHNNNNKTLGNSVLLGKSHGDCVYGVDNESMMTDLGFIAGCGNYHRIICYTLIATYKSTNTYIPILLMDKFYWCNLGFPCEVIDEILYYLF